MRKINGSYSFRLDLAYVDATEAMELYVPDEWPSTLVGVFMRVRGALGFPMDYSRFTCNSAQNHQVREL